MKSYSFKFSFFFALLWVILVQKPLLAQQVQGQMTGQAPDTMSEKPIERDTTPWSWKNNPKVATFASLIFPGAGQIYNKKYWKVPIVWGALGAMGYLVVINNQNFNQYKEAYNYLNTDTTKTKKDYDQWSHNHYTDKELWRYSLVNLSVLRDNSRQDRDRYIIFGALIYVLQMVDAAVDAHLSKFDVSDNLSLHVQPQMLQGGATGLSLRLAFRK